MADKLLTLGNAKNSILGQSTGVNIQFGISKEYATDVETFKTWLANNNIYVVYQLEMPSVIEITDAVLLNDLNELEKMQTYREHTIIQVAPASGNTGNPAQLEVTYWKDDSIDFENRIISLENRVALLE